jgi:SAM-dependent methyltransferase
MSGTTGIVPRATPAIRNPIRESPMDDQPPARPPTEPQTFDIELEDDSPAAGAPQPQDVAFDVDMGVGSDTPVTPPGGAKAFDVDPADYDRFVGRYGRRVAQLFLRSIGAYPGQRGLDVGCGTGALTYEMAQLFGPENTRAIDPLPQFVEATRKRCWGVEVTQGTVEELPYPDDQFDIVMAQLVIDDLEDPRAAVLEMQRVARPGGTVAACVWDAAGDMTLIRTFWDAAIALDPDGAGPLDPGKKMLTTQHRLGQLWRSCGFGAVSLGHVDVGAFYKDFDELWNPFKKGVGVSGTYAASLDAEAQEALKAEFYKRLGSPTEFFELTARAWWVAGS